MVDSRTAEYRAYELDRPLKDHDSDFKFTLQIKGTKHNSKNLDITGEELKQIKHILTTKATAWDEDNEADLFKDLLLQIANDNGYLLKIEGVKKRNI